MFATRAYPVGEPQDRTLRGALVAVRWKRGNPYHARDAVRIAQRLALGLPKPAVAKAERTDEAAIDALLAQDGFAEVIAAWQAILDEDAPEFMVRLEKLCRIALHNALMEWDVGAAVFARRELRQGRNPARTLAERVRARAKQPPRPLPPVAPLAPLGPLPPLDPDYDPLAVLVRRSEAALRDAVLAEQTVQAMAQASTAEAATKALAGKRAAPRRLIPLRHGLFRCLDTGELVEPDAATAQATGEDQPRQTRAP